MAFCDVVQYAKKAQSRDMDPRKSLTVTFAKNLQFVFLFIAFYAILDLLVTVYLILINLFQSEVEMHSNLFSVIPCYML